MPRKQALLEEEFHGSGFLLDPSTPPMEAHQVDSLPDGEGWQFEPKWDGFRCLVFRSGERIEMRAKSGKSLARFFPEMVSLIAKLDPAEFVVDGELLIAQSGTPSFDALQMRLHPAESRIRRLAAETPATLILFDQLVGPSGILLDSPLVNRREALEQFYGRNLTPGLKLSPFSRERRTAVSWLGASGGAIDGVVCKRLDGVYSPGRRTMLKVKCLRTADCVVGGFRYLEREHLVGSLLLGLYNRQGELDHVGFTSAIAAADREALTERLQSLAKPPGFTGKAPGGPSRWATGRSADWVPLKPVLVAEVQYDQITSGRFRHGTKFLRWRPDKAPSQCTFDQLEHGEGPFQGWFA